VSAELAHSSMTIE